MAKQSGIHQIKGKVGEMSYYKQSGVSSGLIRSINQGMSARVKSGEEYANTRRNNVEFGGAADAAKVFIKTIVPKFRPMFVTFAQAKLTKSILALAQANDGVDWGKRSIVAADLSAVLENLNVLAKNDYSTYFGNFVSVLGSAAGKTELDISLTADQVDALIGLGFDGVQFKLATYAVLTGEYNENTGKITKGVRLPISSAIVDAELQAGQAFNEDTELDGKESGATPATLISNRISVCVAMPYKIINEVPYTMQEWCSFAAVATNNHA